MGRNKYYQYFVEGDDDKKIVDTLKTEMQLIIPGKVQKFNVVEKLLNNNHIMSLKEGTHVVLVFDIDTDNVEILKQNSCVCSKVKNFSLSQVGVNFGVVTRSHGLSVVISHLIAAVKILFIKL